MSQFLVTGAGGSIGLPLVELLIKHGGVSALVRRNSKSSVELRKKFGASITLIEGDICETDCGLRIGTIRALAGKFDVMIHVAGAISYHEHLRAETYRVNQTGTENALALATQLEIGRFAFISTCYVAGKKAYLGESDVGISEASNNPYESSKIAAENLVRQYVGESVIIRLSTVIGHSKSGYIVNAGGYAGFVRAFYALRNKLSRYPDHPFLVAVNPKSTLNLVTNDWVVDMITKTVKSSMTGTVHLSHPKPVQMDWLFNESVGRLRLPLTYCREDAEASALWQDPVWRKLQEGIAQGIVGYFGSYVTRDTTFGHERVREVPGYIEPPDITEEILHAQVRYMVDHLFSRRTVERIAA